MVSGHRAAHARQEVLVVVHGECGVGVTEAFGDDLDCGAVGETGGDRYSNRVECLALFLWLLHLVGLWGGVSIVSGDGRVVGPVASCGVDPIDGGVDSYAEHLGEDYCGNFGCELELCGPSCFAGIDAECAESLSELAGGDGSAG